MQNFTKATRAVKRHITKLSDEQRTDQSAKKSCDINNIVKQFAKTGILPKSDKIPHYGDFSDVPTLEEAFNIANNAADMFYELPASLRKLIDNDPSKLEAWLSDKKNDNLAIEFGLRQKPEPVKKPEIIVKNEPKNDVTVEK